MAFHERVIKQQAPNVESFCSCPSTLVLHDRFVLVQVNCEAGAQLKSAWTALVNARAAWVRGIETVRTEKFSYLDVDALESSRDFDNIMSHYECARNKICEITAARALVRPIPTDQTRAALVRKAKDTIEALEGKASPSLSIMMQAVLDADTSAQKH